MVLSLLRLLGSSYKGRNRSDNWELIGQDTHAGRSVDRVPKWVLREVGRRGQETQHLDAWAADLLHEGTAVSLQGDVQRHGSSRHVHLQ